MRQGNDHGSQYRSAIYPLSTTQMEAALSSKDDYQKVGSLPAPGFRMPSAPAVSPARSAPPARRESGSFHPALCSICTFFGNVCQPLGIEPLCFINVLISEILKTDLYAFLFKINLSRWICSLAYSLSPSLCLSPAVSLHHSLFLSSLCINLLRFITKYHRLDGSNNRNVFLTVLENGSPWPVCQHGPVLVRTLLLVADHQLLIVPLHGKSRERKQDLSQLLKGH